MSKENWSHMCLPPNFLNWSRTWSGRDTIACGLRLANRPPGAKSLGSIAPDIGLVCLMYVMRGIPSSLCIGVWSLAVVAVRAEPGRCLILVSLE